MNQINKNLLERFFRNQCTPQETEMVARWLADPKNRQEVDAMMESKWDEDFDEMTSHDLDGMYKKIESRISVEDKGWKKKSPYRFYLAAAVISLIAVVSIFYFQNRTLNETVPNKAFITKVAASGDKLTTQLPDGSIVMLNSESEIQYSDAYGISDRRIILKGEALFDVAKDPDRPFIVDCGDMAVTALGTVFNINAFNPMEETKVTLLSGKVNVKAEKDEVFLEKGEVAIFKKTAKKLIKGQEDIKTTALWAEGIIHFDKTPMDEVVITLERWYGVDIELINAPQQIPVVHGSFENAKLESVLKSIGFALEFDHERTNEKVIIKFRQ